MIKGRFGKMLTGALVVSLLAVGLVVLAESGFGGKGSDDWNTARAAGECTQLAERDADGDGIANCNDVDWARPLDGSGYGRMQGYGMSLRDGSGVGQPNGARGGVVDGECDGGGYGYGAHGSI